MCEFTIVESLLLSYFIHCNSKHDCVVWLLLFYVMISEG